MLVIKKRLRRRAVRSREAVMQIFFFDPLETALLDILAWGMFHLSIGYGSSIIPVGRLNPNRRFFQTFAWEKGGEIYEKIFHVRSWKRFIPNGSALYRGAFSIKNLPTHDPLYLERWLKESVRAEVCHWVMILPGFLFFLWNSVSVGWLMVLYAVVNNLVPIILQRFNRPRMRRFLAHARIQAPDYTAEPALQPA
jgi:glycosyl-4,4'-diaponeurosporenoate acyltransferase